MDKRRLMAAVSAVMLFSGGCSAGPRMKGTADNEILTMKPVDQKKIPITVRYEYGAADVIDLEQYLEEELPEVDIIMMHDGSSSSAYTLRQNLQNGVECDIILSRRAQSIMDIASHYLLDLSGQSFTGNYYAYSLETCMTDEGRLYFLPGPSDVYGVVYNRTMFEKNGWQVPHSYSEFAALIRTINNAGLKATETEDGGVREVDVKAIQPSLKHADAFQVLFNTFAYDKVYRSAENQRWLSEYRQGRGAMAGHMEPAVDVLRQLYSDGIISWGDWNVLPGYRSRKMYRYHSTAMILENQNAYIYNEKYSDSGNMDEVGIFPLWTSDKPDSDYLYAIPSYYYAINKASAEESEEKRKILLHIMEFLSRPETQKKLLDNALQISNIIGVPINESAFGKEICKTIKEGRIINTFSLTDTENFAVEAEMLKNLPELLQGSMSVEEWLRRADLAQSSSLSGADKKKVYGKSERTFTKLETAQLAGDMYRRQTGAPIALVFVGENSEGVNGRLYRGDITDDSLECISGAATYNPETTGLASGTMTGQQIMDFLSGKEGSNPSLPEVHIVASGLLVEYSPWSAAGDRLISCRLPDGSSIEPDAEYLVAYYAGSLRHIEDGISEPAKIKNENILAGTWEEHFISWLNDTGKEVKATELTTKLVWKNDTHEPGGEIK